MGKATLPAIHKLTAKSFSLYSVKKKKNLKTEQGEVVLHEAQHSSQRTQSWDSTANTRKLNQEAGQVRQKGTNTLSCCPLGWGREPEQHR